MAKGRERVLLKIYIFILQSNCGLPSPLASSLFCMSCLFVYLFLLPKSNKQGRLLLLMHKIEFSQIKIFGLLVLFNFLFLDKHVLWKGFLLKNHSWSHHTTIVKPSDVFKTWPSCRHCLLAPLAAVGGAQRLKDLSMHLLHWLRPPPLWTHLTCCW